MLKKILTSLLPFLAASCDRPQEKPSEAALMDPNQILFSLATLCDPIPATQPGTPTGSNKQLHEDDWRQIEFVQVANKEHVQAKLKELIAFKKAHQKGPGFTKVFIRPEHPTTFASTNYKATQLPRLTEYSLTLGGGAVVGGFALSDGGGWFIYGQRSAEGEVLHLAVSPDSSSEPSDALVNGIIEIAGSNFIFVDWYAATVVDTSSTQAVQNWARRFK
jgi:hypothetical protein